MGMRKPENDGVTIVGGRPMHRAVETKDLPQGVEQVLTLAGLDPAFRAAVALDPVVAAAAKGIRLDDIEASLLRSMPPDRIAAMADRMIIPRAAGRRTFMKAVSASVVAMVAGNAFMLCSGCTGADSWEPSDAGPSQQWMTLAGYTCYVCVPSSAMSDTSTPSPVLVALHGETETCLSSAQRWQAASEELGFLLIAVNWTQDARLPEERDVLVTKFGDIMAALNEQYPVHASKRHLCGRGASADMVFKAALLGQGSASFEKAMMLGGVPAGDWANDAEALLQDKSLTAAPLYYLVGKQDADYEQAVAFAGAIEQRGVSVERSVVEGSTSDAKLSFANLWAWLAG